MFGATCIAVIQELEPEQIAEMSIEELMDFLQEKGKNRFENPEEIAKYLQKIARSSYRLNKAMADPVNISSSERSLRFIPLIYHFTITDNCSEYSVIK